MSAPARRAPRTMMLLEEHLEAVAEAMGVRMLMTERESVRTVSHDRPIAEARAVQGLGFDSVPVMDGERAVGVLWAQEGDAAGAARTAGEAARPVATLGAGEGIERAFEALSAAPVALVVGVRGELAGLIHLADLNRQAVRVYLYLWLSALEMGLAELVLEHRPTMEEWVGALDARSMTTILGRHQYHKLQNIDLHPIEGVELSDLVKIVEKTESAWRALGFESKQKFKEASGRVVDLRHEAMHPVRTLVRDQEDARRQAERMATLRDMVVRARRAISASA